MTAREKEPIDLRGTLSKIIFHSDENGYLIALLKDGSGTSSVVGYMPEPREGDEYVVTGKWTIHPKYGRQFQFESYELKPPTTERGIEEYLASGLIHGIGPALASRIVMKFGPKTLDVINRTPDRLREVEGIGPRKLEQIKVDASAMRDMQEVIAFLKSHQVSTANAVRIYKTYGKNSIVVVQGNPYQLVDDVVGIGFHTADAIARNSGVEPESSYRLMSGLRFVLDDACRVAGHCYLLREELLRRGTELLQVDEAKVDRALDSAIEAKTLQAEGEKIFPPALRDAEIAVAERLRRLLKRGAHPFDEKKLRSSLRLIEKRHDLTFDPKQRDAIVHALCSPVTILTGGPGTGKTLCVNGIIELADELGLSCLLCAPTGRAAKRLADLTGREAKTIHRLLEFEPISGVFRRDESHPLECRLLIADEMSMVDIELFAALLDGVNPETQLVLVGDVDQLPSVGPGQVLRDLIDSKSIGTVRLDTIFRQAEESSIITNSRRVNAGESPHFTKDFQFIEERIPEKSQDTVVSLCATILPQNHRYDPFMDIQVLSPMHNSPAGVRELNRELQNALNGRSKVCWQGSERKFLLGDKVMQVKNNYEKDVFNGDIGRVAGVDREEGILLVDYDGRNVSYPFEQLDELVLAYAMTIHKSQGNEFKAVVVPLLTSHYIMLQRNLLYTAITRARELLVIVGERKALAIAVRNDDVRLRNTCLRQLLEIG